MPAVRLTPEQRPEVAELAELELVGVAELELEPEQELGLIRAGLSLSSKSQFCLLLGLLSLRVKLLLRDLPQGGGVYCLGGIRSARPGQRSQSFVAPPP